MEEVHEETEVEQEAHNARAQGSRACSNDLRSGSRRFFLSVRGLGPPLRTL